jgi:hypothetical protein
LKLEREVNSFEQHLRKNPRLQERNQRRHNSVNLDKWRNIGLSCKKERISKKINSYFTIKIPDEEISPAARTLELAHPPRPKSNNKCRLRYALNDEEKTTASYSHTLSTFRSFKNAESTHRSLSRAKKASL